MDAYLDRGTIRDGTPLKKNQRTQVRKNLKRCLRGVKDLRAMGIDRALLARMRAQAGTVTMVKSSGTPSTSAACCSTGTRRATSPRAGPSSSPAASC